jgi:hypothetical protein
MADWITLTEADVLTQLSGAELAAVNAVSLKSGQDAPLPAIMADVSELVRGYCGRQAQGSTGTIPVRVKTKAIDIIIPRLFNRLGASVSKGRQDAAAAAEEFFEKQVQSGKFELVAGDTNIEQITRTDRVTGRDNLNGI